ncbi:hypothetical protein [Stenotrophomonas phage RAS14]
MTEYIVKFTDKSKTPITVYENSIDNSSTDISLPGRKKLEYGRDLNANFLHILENFACPEDPENPGFPDFEKASFQSDTNKKLLTAPVEGQLWFNLTQETLFVWNGSAWLALGMDGDIASNWGVLTDGMQIPRPKNKYGYTFKYEECAWIVSPFKLEGSFRYMQCTTDDNGWVTMTYTPESPNAAPIKGCATYMIVGIKGNVNLGQQEGIPDATPIPSPTPTPTPSITKSAQPTPTASVTPTPWVSATQTPQPTPSATPPPSASPTPTPINYIASISASPAGQVAPGANICYTISLNYPAPAAGKDVRLIRSGDTSNICASTEGETVGPIISDETIQFSAGQLSTQICRTAPAAPPPPPTPTATPRYACKQVAADGNVWGATYWTGFMCQTNNGGPQDYFTNTSGGSGNYYPCTQWTACNNATSFSSTQTIANNPVRGNRVYYNAVPAAQLVMQIQIPGVASSNVFNTYIYGTTPQTQTHILTAGSRTFTLVINMNPVLVSTSGSNKTWTIYTDYTVTDNQTGVVTAFCNI